MSLSIIHISDIHIKGENDIILSRANKLKAACTSSLPNKGNVVIAVTGDIAFSGEEAQYKLAKSLFEQIAEYIHTEKNSTVDIVFVPGNHDCNFLKETSVRQALVECPKPSEVDNDYYAAVSVVQEEYRAFAREHDINVDEILPIKRIAVGDNSVAFLLGNTAWMSVLKEDPGRIVMPEKLFGDFNPKDYKVVFYMYHHPESWLNQNYKRGFIDHIRRNADMVLVGHEHLRDSYKKEGESFSFYCSHGKELQDSESDNSAFSVVNFDTSFQTYDVVDFVWKNDHYVRQNESKTNQYHKNIASDQNVFVPNQKTVDKANDAGIIINHFSKEDVTLSDLFVWPDINRNDYHKEDKGPKTIRANVVDELSNNDLTILVAPTSGGKTAVAKQLFLLEESKNCCCLLLNGRDFNSSEDDNIRKTIENGFKSQYSEEYLEEFNQLSKKQRKIIVDDFDYIKLNNDRRIKVLDYLCGFFGNVTILLSSNIELPSILTTDQISSSDQLIYYDILPLGNTKRKEIISKWYHLDEKILSEDEISERIEKARNQIDIFLGNGAAFIPAMPVFVIGTLQNADAKNPSFNGSKYGFLYESLISSSLAKVPSAYSKAGSYNIDQSLLSKLAFDMLKTKKTSFTDDELEKAIKEISDKFILQISSREFLNNMIEAKIIYKDSSGGEVYRFKYPYIYYYFSGRYIAFHLKEKDVKTQLEIMSTKLYNETYGNVIIFVCHFAGNKEVIDNILINAYETLSDYCEFDFTKTNQIFEEIKDAVEALIPSTISDNSDVPVNKDNKLRHMDEAGINDGHVDKGEEVINDDISEKEKELAALTSAMKTIEVLGQILQNYPVGVEGPDKIEIISEMRNLGMRSVQAIINTMGLVEEELIEYVYQRSLREKKNFRREDIASATRHILGMLICSMAQGMVHQVALSLNSEHLLKAAKQTFEADTSLSSKLILLDLKLNCLNKVVFNEVQGLKKAFDNSNEKFASRILDSIVAHYLNFHQCDYVLRSQLCELCGLSEKKMFIEQRKNLLK